MSGALRFNEGKPKLSYFMRSFPKMVEAIARVKEFGANKYNEGNWRQGNKPDQEYWDSLFRHLSYIFAGEMYDQDSGCLHLGHAVWNLCALLELNYPGMSVIDEELFQERMEYWADQKKLQETNKQPSCKDRGEHQLVYIIEEQGRVPSFQKVLDRMEEQMKADAKKIDIEAELEIEKAVDEVMSGYSGTDVDEIKERSEPSTSKKIAAVMAKMDQGASIEEIRRTL